MDGWAYRVSKLVFTIADTDEFEGKIETLMDSRGAFQSSLPKRKRKLKCRWGRHLNYLNIMAVTA